MNYKMSVVIVGGDNLGCIPKELDRIGISKIQHLNGRSGQKIRGKMSDRADFIILLYDFVNHNLAYKVKKFASNKGIPIIYAKRSWPSIFLSIQYHRQELIKAGYDIAADIGKKYIQENKNSKR